MFLCYHARHLKQIHCSQLLWGMYGLTAKSSIARLNICQILMRYFSSYILYFSLQSVAQSPEIRATLAGAKPESFVLTPDQCSENNKLSNARCFTIVRIYLFILLKISKSQKHFFLKLHIHVPKKRTRLGQNIV